MNSKTANLEDAISGNVTLGTGDYKRSTVDANRSINDTTAFRTNLVVQDAGVDGRDEVENIAMGVATSLGLGLSTDTRAFVNLYHMQQRNVPDGGVSTAGLEGYYSSNYAPAFPAGGPEIPEVDTDTFFGSTSDYNDVDASMVTLRIEHDLAKDVVLRNTSRYGRFTQDMVLTGTNAVTFPSVDSAAWQVALTRQGRDQTNQILTNQTNLTMSFDTAGVKHNIASGVEFICESQFTNNVGLPFLSPTSSTRVTQQTANLYNPDNANIVYQPVIRDGAKTDGETTTSALYVLDTITLTDQWQVSAGVRAERFYANIHSGYGIVINLQVV